MARKQTIEAFWKWIAVEENERRVLEELTRDPLHKVARTVKQPYTCLYEYFRSTPEREARYAAAKEAWVEMRKGALVEKVDAVKPDKDEVARLKLEHEIIDNQAKAYHRERWGERVQVDKTISVQADVGLIGAAADLLALAKTRALPAEKVIEGEVVEAGKA